MTMCRLEPKTQEGLGFIYIPFLIDWISLLVSSRSTVLVWLSDCILSSN